MDDLVRHSCRPPVVNSGEAVLSETSYRSVNSRLITGCYNVFGRIELKFRSVGRNSLSKDLGAHTVGGMSYFRTKIEHFWGKFPTPKRPEVQKWLSTFIFPLLITPAWRGVHEEDFSILKQNGPRSYRWWQLEMRMRQRPNTQCVTT